MKKITPFQQRVYEALSTVPFGMVTTYKHLALAIGCGSARAIGQALRCNPFAPKVPCHRVIKSDHSIGGFAGSASGAEVKRKRTLLEGEGVFFESGKLADLERLFKF